MIAYYVLFLNSGDVEGGDEEFTLMFGPCSSFRYIHDARSWYISCIKIIFTTFIIFAARVRN